MLKKFKVLLAKAKHESQIRPEIQSIIDWSYNEAIKPGSLFKIDFIEDDEVDRLFFEYYQDKTTGKFHSDDYLLSTHCTPEEFKIAISSSTISIRNIQTEKQTKFVHLTRAERRYFTKTISKIKRKKIEEVSVAFYEFLENYEELKK